MAIVSFRRDEIPPLSDADKAELRALAARPDSEIDTVDIPELTDEQLARMRPGYEVMAEWREKQVATV
jgi:hypothetical protein